MSRSKEDPVFNCVEELRLQQGLSRQQLADAEIFSIKPFRKGK
jgi:hypothetical protein